MTSAASTSLLWRGTFSLLWRGRDLSHLWGFPTFEEGVFAVLNDNFSELNSIFSQYAKSGTAGSSSMNSLLTMQTTEFTNLALDCGICTDEFTDARLNTVFLRADQVDEKAAITVSATGDEGDGSGKVMSAVRQGDHGLQIHEFFEALVAVALYRANPDLGELGELDASDPLPGCLEALLKNQVLTNAKRDKLALVKSALETDADVQQLVPDIKKRLQTSKKHNVNDGLPEYARSFDEVTAVGVRKVFGKQVMDMEILQNELTTRRVAKELTVTPQAKVQGDVFPTRHMNLSWLDCKNAFTTCQFVRDGRDQSETDEGNATIDFDEFVLLLGLMGSIKYEEIDEMSLADKFLALADNWLLTRDEQAVINDHCVPPPPRYDFRGLSKPLKGQDEKEHTMLVETYAKSA